MAGSGLSRSFSYPDSDRPTRIYPASACYSRIQDLRGLVNYGLSCCVNALLQSFSATHELVVLLNKWDIDDRGALVKTHNVPLQLQRILQAMQSQELQPVPHKDFLHCLDRNNIRLYKQHDADEVFLSILNLIQEQMSDKELAQEIRRLYMVTVEEHLQCMECRFIECGTSYLLSLPLPLREEDNTLEESFRNFFELQELRNMDECFCNRCGEKQPSRQGLRLIKLPPVVCIHLKRFRSTGGYTKKLYSKVSFPQTIDFKEILEPEQVSGSFLESEWQYNLYAVIVHCGSAMFGHYTAYIKHPGDNEWYHADDSRVRKR
ncbi:ubl carboxyl-terminal hydrolase 18 [Megalops cyprinoides]|uniref:ubl carboxyl-terminal hydrolase 18 n=1 Tax=Megalops cyprinoides TaxID=118141 RepID=UPI0018644D34|nr:ubl carboxyl-terminal hydrolase 18 [Megalops cyprinoides]